MLWTWKWYIGLSCVLALILLGIIVFITVHFTHQSDISPAPPEPTTPFKPTTPTTPSTPTTPEIPNSSTEDNCPSRKYFVMQARHEANGNNETEFRIVERDEWGAQPSRPLRKMMLPVSYVIIFHTATAFCTTQSKCANQLRIIQNNQMEGIFDDIAYNFMVGGDGLAYVGRNWNYVGGYSRHYNGISIGIAFIGDFTSVVPPKTQLNAAKELIKFGVRAEKIAPDYKLLGARQVVTTKNPGNALYNEIIKWPHWSSEPYWLDRLVKSVYVS
ncbi:peptidoglycan-recognition protein SA-like [Temnothorax curvispinosus]|uniref:Peptidoglycan-recognition protein SA-like n=1 Tax=Temnothorax curvispinosus TaxID=300111 RepID=A0A6J1R6Z1_9HYME|nr:peptidoglycan-recognition protein SA-like [Temnothorax curvispinosus]XP_024889978.1 peptidoglycan-recognition protein SA-like [Temnothorax curvispinosus]